MPILYIKNGNTFVPINAINGLSAYDIAKKNGYTGTETEWLASLKGETGTLDNLTKANVENVLTGDITSHNHGTQIAAVLTDYVLKVVGKGLSTNDFTDALLTKLNGLSNYDDTTISSALTTLQNQLNTLVSGNASTAIESFNEITSFLANVTDSETLEGILAGLNTTIANSLATAKQYADDGISTHNTSNTAHQDIRNSIPTSPATQSANGLMSSTDKTKLDGVETEANKYVLPTASMSVLGGVKVGSNLAISDGVLSAKDTFLYGYNSVTTLASLPISKRLIVASVSAATDISLTSDLEVGQELLICLTASADITQPIPTSGGFTSMDGDSISISSGGYAEISILCIGTSTYKISTKVAS